jgi:hypothetical protein
MPPVSSMLIRNLITGSTPGVLHRNGNPPEWHTQWQRVVAEFFAETHEPCEPCPELTILTWNNRPTKSLLERCLDRRGVPYQVLGKHVSEFRPHVKLYLNADALDRVQSEYVMALDADDLLVVSSPRDILATFKRFECDILFSSERNSYPKVPFLVEFEKSIAESDYRHLNSGAWIGKTQTCRQFFRDCCREDNSDILAAHPAKHVLRDDQGLTRKTFRKYHPGARLDYQCQIFQSLFKVPTDGEVMIRAQRPLPEGLGPAQVRPLDETGAVR